ncbi:hypothetical protein H1164_17315 [Thermoactinomyces daqus]|uniref:Uncharacterized protein n=1 Tax=Thermoactinomyces daqus TaxID=1329516 RepID=A0A7W2AK81_9BACL|nr:hypothetical protein [Thermoactinomyces daqus]MBA4544589.1 hypothetical protein [Thermoactinomyces daqus]
MGKISKNRGTKTIIRKRKNKDNPYVTINKTVFENQPEISLEAKGLMGIFLCKPDNWKIIMEEIINESKNGRDAHYKALKELRKHGFVVLIEFRIKGKVAQKEYVVCEDPVHNPFWEKPLIVKVSSQEEIDEWNDEDIESIIESQENQEVEPDTEFQDQAKKKSVQPHPEKPDRVKPDEEKPDREMPTLLTNHSTNETSDEREQQLTLHETASLVVGYQTTIKNKFGKKLSIKHIEKLIGIANKEKKSLDWAIENTYEYHKKVEPRENPYGAIKHALESDGWVIPEEEKTSAPFVLSDEYAKQYPGLFYAEDEFQNEPQHDNDFGREKVDLRRKLLHISGEIQRGKHFDLIPSDQVNELLAEKQQLVSRLDNADNNEEINKLRQEIEEFANKVESLVSIPSQTV